MLNRHRRFHTLHAVVILAGIIPASSLHAQELPAGQDRETGGATPDDSTNGDIVVTAQRRQQSIRDVPISIAALDQKSLDQKGVRSIADLSRLTPGITLTPGWAGSSNISVRGISSGIGAGTTGIYLDDTPIQVRAVGSGTTATNPYPAVFDLDRIEVLRGPQGTLFGAGSEGGNVRFITPQPGLKAFSGYGRAELASTENGDLSHEIGVAIGGPIVVDRIGFRFSAFERRDGGYVDRVDPDTLGVVDKNSNWARTQVVRGALTFVPVDGLKVTASVFHQDLYRNDTQQYWRNISDPENQKFYNGQTLRQPGTDRFTLYSASIQYDASWASVISNTSYFTRKNPSVADYSNYGAEILGGDYNASKAVGYVSPSIFANNNKVFTQEVRLQSAGGGSLHWVIGAFYQDARQRSNQDVEAPNLDALTSALYGLTVEETFGLPLYQPGGISFLSRDWAQDEQIAGFGQIDYNIADKLTLTAGVRVARAKFKFTNYQDGPFNGGPTFGAGSKSQTPVTPKFGVEYKPSSSLMLYASAAKGFRPGGGNTPIPVSTCAADLAALGLSRVPSSFDSDSVWSYEVGAKGELADHHIRFESSAFYIDWSKIQQAVALTGCGAQFISNLGSARSKGFDLHLTVNPFAGLTLEGSVGYTDAQFTKTILSSPTSGGALPVIVNKGDRLLVAPWNLTISADYETPAIGSSSLKVYAHSDFNFTNAFNWGGGANTVSYDPVNARMSATYLLNGRIGVRRGDIDLSLFVNNVLNSTDRLAITHDTFTSALVRDVTFRPRTIGATASIRF